MLKNNPVVKKKVQMGILKSRMEPGDYWQIEFSELPWQNGFCYILVGVDTFAGWPEAFPGWSNTSHQVSIAGTYPKIWGAYWNIFGLKSTFFCMSKISKIRALVKCWELPGIYVLLGGHNPVEK